MLNRQASAGFTLVEVMVTVFVVAIGLLSAAGLQALSKKAAYESMQRSTATLLAQDMLERIRANSAMKTSYAPVTGKTISVAPSATVTCGSSSGSDCDSAQLVDYDLAQWWRALDGANETIAAGTNGSGTAITNNAGGLREPVGCIRTTTSGTASYVEVAIAWRGMSKISQGDSSNAEDPTNDSCGAAGYEAVGAESYRRVLRLQAHIS